ncbi:hypothetical protein B0T11DRAFT_118724 [Plectosphaerella cucumerina]|uniref:Uncharacterized protein n=1 Tax=Plectosphaerella cucumerina TaxID=40658 RepID=A0A8K0T802_9PEZI|nr:hypothetical protein B0T11DRAFT_118724 [Plectosphaerella cucumerina]
MHGCILCLPCLPMTRVGDCGVWCLPEANRGLMDALCHQCMLYIGDPTKVVGHELLLLALVDKPSFRALEVGLSMLEAELVAVEGLKPPTANGSTCILPGHLSRFDNHFHQVHHVRHTRGPPPLDNHDRHPCSRRLAPLRLPVDLLSRLISLQPPFNIRRINTRSRGRIFQHFMLSNILRPAMVRVHHSINQRPLHLGPVLPADQTYQSMSIPRCVARSQLTAPGEDDPRRAACSVHALRQRHALLQGAVC